MRLSPIGHCGILLTLTLAGAISLAMAREGEREVPLDDIPPKAFKALVLLKGDTDFEEIESEKEDGVQVFEAEWEEGDRDYSACVDSEGHLLEREHTVGVDELPEAVVKAIAKHLPKGGEREVKMVLTVRYEANVELNGKEYELETTPSGRVIADDDDDDDDE